MKQGVTALIDQALQIVKLWPQKNETCRYQQFNTAEGARIHGFSFTLPGVSKEEKEALVSELAVYLLVTKIAAAENMGHIGHNPTDLGQIYDCLEMMDRPDPPTPTPEANDYNAQQHPLYQRMLELDGERDLFYQAEKAKFQNQSRVYFDNMVEDSAVMLFLINPDYQRLEHLRSNRLIRP